MRIEQTTTLSARKGAFGSEFCKPRQLKSIGDLRKAGLIPRSVKKGDLLRAAEKVTNPVFYKVRSESLLEEELKRIRRPRTEQFNSARLAHFAREVQVEGLAKELDPDFSLASRKSIAMKAVGLIGLGSYTVTEFSIDEDLLVRAPLTFDSDILVCRARDIRVLDGAIIQSRAPYFIMHARSFEGSYRSAGESGANGTTGTAGTDGGQGGSGRHALCRDMLHKDQVPSNGGPGGDGGDGGSGSNGGDGGDGTPYEAHIQVLTGGENIDTSGGPGGKGGVGGKGGKGGAGGPGGNGNGCEPAGLGGAGGNGGDGGTSGTGGNGGDAGELFVYYVSDQSAGNPPVLTSDGGAAGQPGQGQGAGGDPGAPGKPGKESKYGKARWDPLEAAGGVVPGPGLVGKTGGTGSPGRPGLSKEVVKQQVPVI